jgi:hypothetical protein
MQKRVSIRQEGISVLVVVDGRAVLEMPWQAALDVSMAIRIQAKEAEALAKVEGIIWDQAILVRSGAPFGLTSHRDMLKEATKEAAWNSPLRKYMPGGIKSQAVFGVPRLIQHPPARGESDEQV